MGARPVDSGRTLPQLVTTTRGLPYVIAASSAGTMIEFYDFFLFASLASVLAEQFYPPGNPNVGFVSTLATFAVGLAVRPLGSLLFGRIGDKAGRKTTFLATLLLMGASTAAIGLLPGYAQIGIAAPVLLLTCRMFQGLAIGGEYGGAATYVAEHAPEHRRGVYTSFIQAMPTLGLFVSTVVVLVTRDVAGGAAFAAWAWRIPFLLSLVLVVISYYIRVRLDESPVFAALKAAGHTSVTPVRDSFGTWERWRVFLIVLFGAAAGQAVLAYASQVYVLFFLQRVLEVPLRTSYVAMAGALLLLLPLFVVFGALSDRIGRKPVMLGGNLLAVLTFYPIYYAIRAAASPPRLAALTLLVFLQMVPLALAYAPFAAYLVETFPARIRYTSVSLPYNLGNGWFGGFLPLIATTVVAQTGNIYAWLVYPVAVALVTVAVGSLFATESYRRHLWDEVSGLSTPRST